MMFQHFILLHISEYVYDNSLNPAMNIWNGLRYKIYFDWNAQVNECLPMARNAF